jgi:predicted RNase H-like HicB family nuclease
MRGVRNLGEIQGSNFSSIAGFGIKAIVHQAEEGSFWAEVPALPGCLTQGETREIRGNLLEAIELCFEAVDEETPGK